MKTISKSKPNDPKLMYRAKVLLNAFLLLISSSHSSAQTGSSGNPFTSLGQAGNVTGSGIYYFNLSGTTFSSYVENGWVLIASDSGSSASGALPKTTSLSTAQRGILSPSVLANFTSATALKVSTSDGNVNDSTSSSGLINRMIHDSSLNLGLADVSLNSSWVGSGIYAACVKGATANATSVTRGAHLDSCLFWPDGDVNGFHWIPYASAQREDYSATGEEPNTVAFDLWVESSIVTLPVIFSSFNGRLLSNNTIQLNWTTATELNGDYIIVKKSLDGQNWSQLTMNQVQGSSDRTVNYSAIDYNPNNGNNYYRLSEVDLDGNTTFSQIILINDSKEDALLLYPNPTNGVTFLKGDNLGMTKIYSLAGQDVTYMVKQNKIGENLIEFNFGFVPNGLYFIEFDGYLMKEMVLNK